MSLAQSRTASLDLKLQVGEARDDSGRHQSERRKAGAELQMVDWTVSEDGDPQTILPFAQLVIILR